VNAGAIAGLVRDTSGAPLAEVAVTTPDGAKAAATTGVDGTFTLTDLQPSEQTLIHFQKDGYTNNWQTVAVHGGVVSTVQATLKQRRAPVTFQADENIGLFVGNDRIALPANSLVTRDGSPVTGAVTLWYNSLDVSTKDLDAFPGNFTTGNENELLETYALAEIILEQNGEQLDLDEGQSATIELRLPDDTPLLQDDAVAAWYFDEQQGIWVEQGEGAAGEASGNSAALSWTAQVGHFSWWNADSGQPVYCVMGQVKDRDGDPVPGALAHSVGVNYRGESRTWTDADGEFCIHIKGGSTAVSQITITRANFTPLVLIVQADDDPSNCGSGDCQDLGELTLNHTYGYNGRVVDVNGDPLVGIAVWCDAFTTTTDSDGEFCIDAPAGSAAVIRAKRTDFPSVRTSAAFDVPDEEAPCSTGGLGDAGTLTLPDPYCYEGRVLEFDGAPLADVTVETISENSRSYVSTDADGEFCVDVAPGAEFTLSTRHPDHPFIIMENSITAPFAEGSCANGGCGTLDDIRFPNVSCISGTIENGDGTPNTEIRQVWTSEGNLALTEAGTGEFCIDAGAEKSITVFGFDCLPDTVITPESGACGDPSACANVVLIVPGDEPAEVLVPAGSFFMGCEPEDTDCHPWSEYPRHEVSLTNDYYLDTFEVTNAQYAHYLNNTNPTNECETYPCVYSMHDYSKLGLYEDGGAWLVDADYENRPVIGVTWFGAVAYCESLGKRLPTEAEWEKAAKGADEHYIYPWGETIISSALNYWSSGDPYETGAEPWTTPVGYYDGTNQGGVYQTTDGRSPYGAHDMSGNLFEWCYDWWNDHYYENEPPGGWIDPLGPETGEYRILRGGCWATNNQSNFRNSFRWGLGPYINTVPTWGDLEGSGFRCARDPE